MTQDTKKDTILHTGKGTYVRRLMNICSSAYEHMFIGTWTYVLEQAKQIVRPERTGSLAAADYESAWGGQGKSLTLLRSLLLLLILTLGTTTAWGQDYSGTYYIRSESPNKNTAGNYYICPTKGWYLYKAINSYENDTDDDDDNGQPFLTTYQCKAGNYDVKKAVWTIEKHPTKDNCYYIIQNKTGRYMVSNGKIGTSAYRMRVHLEAVADANALSALDDLPLFEITSHDGHIDIVPHSTAGRVDDTYKYIVVNFKNFNELVGSTGKTGGPNNSVTAGIIGLYDTEDNHKWFLEKAEYQPVVTDNHDGTVTITSESGATIYYTIDGSTPTTETLTSGTSPVIVSSLTESTEVIKAIAYKSDSYALPSAVTTYNLPQCVKPVITVSSGTVTITCSTPGATIRYTVDDTEATLSSPNTYSSPFSIGDVSVIRAIASKVGYAKSEEAYYLDFKTVHSSTEIMNMRGSYFLANDFTSSSSIGSSDDPFKGVIDGQMNTFSNLDHPLVAYADGATIKNVILDNVTISGGANVGAICNEATGASRIYNCGILATNSTMEEKIDEDEYDHISSCSSTISGSGYVGGIVGLLDGSSRVINCFSYANVSGGSHVGGIVGYNNVATTASNLKTMVMNCMFYGEVSGSSIAPIYNGLIITNDGDADGVNNFNYFRLEASYIKNTGISKVYNCALGAETRFLQRFEFFRHLLNSNRELAAWWATGDADNKDEMMKWVMDPSQIGTTMPYPILKVPGKYPSVVNYTPSTTAYDETNRNKGRKLTSEGDGGVLHVTIQMGTNTGSTPFSQPSGAGLKSGIASSFDLTITDKDFEHFNFNYGKVQLPYYNDYCDGNYTENRVVTGWKIVSITGGTGSGTTSYSSGADDVTYNTNGELTATPYNFADRKCTKKDLYGTGGSNRVFNQGAYWDVPDEVTAITIEPYWGKAVYLADAYWDVTYKNGTGTDLTKPGSTIDAMTTAANVSNVGGGIRYENAPSFNNQTVYTSIGDAISGTALYAGTNEATYSARSVYDYAVVLVGNYHHNSDIAGGGKPYTVTSVDLDGDNEPDYSFMLRFNARTGFHPVRYDFLNLMGLGMAQKTTGGTGSYNLGIMQPKYWFEVTNTALFRVTQFEYSQKDRVKNPYILQGGVIEQWVTQQQDAGDKVSYFHVGGNVWFKEFHRGSHQDNKDKSTPHPPVSVTGGDFVMFYLTGYYQSQATIYDDNAECYINGGRFGEMAGAGMEGIGTSDGKGNITWIIDNADIKEFFGGGINFAKPVHGNIHTIISNSQVDQFCGGPKFGDMEDGRTVTTTATNCTFGTYFGAGYGGNSYNRHAPRNHNNIVNFPHSDGSAGNHASWNAWLTAYYKQEYNADYGGVSTQFDYQFLPMSSNTDNVARIFVEYAGFSLATTHDVVSSLTGCKITGNFYGGGSLGKVAGNVESTLDNCIVKGNVFGAGFSASVKPVEVMDLSGFKQPPYYYEDLGTFYEPKKPDDWPDIVEYTWQHRDGEVNSTATAIDKVHHILYTQEDLRPSNLGSVSGGVTLTITTSGDQGRTVIGTEGDSSTGHVYGGGDESYVYNETTPANAYTIVTITGNTEVKGNVFGGGNKGLVSGSATVNIGETPSNDSGSGSGGSGSGSGS